MVASMKINPKPETKAEDSTGIDMKTGNKMEEKVEASFLGGLSDAVWRQGFIMKVYGILTIQMFSVLVFVGAFLYFMDNHNPNSEYSHTVFAWIILLSPIVLIPLTFHFKNLRRKAPGNLILLLVLSLSEAIVFGAVMMDSKMDAIFLAAGTVVMVTLSITLFALQTKVEFTTARGFVLVFTVVFLLFGLYCQFLGEMLQTKDIRAASFFAALSCIALVGDTRRLLRVQGKDKLTLDDYVYTALTLQLDVFNIFFLYTTVALFYLMLFFSLIVGSIEFTSGFRMWPKRIGDTNVSEFPGTTFNGTGHLCPVKDVQD